MPYDKVFEKFGKGKLHSGGPKGPLVKDKKQAIAIFLSEKAKAEEGNTEYAHSKGHSKGKAALEGLKRAHKKD